MSYDHEQARTVLKAYQEAGEPLPPWAAEIPKIGQAEALVYAAFVDCGTCRHVGFGLGPIPWEAYQRWAEAQGLMEGERDDVWFAVSLVDAEMLKQWSEKSNASVSNSRRV